MSDSNKWLALRERLKTSYEVNGDWNNAIELFKSRIQNRYFKPIEQIIRGNNLNGEGFAITTVQCALIESFAAFRQGKIYNHKSKKGGPSYEYRDSKQLYIAFLRSVDVFLNNFSTHEEAEDFYKNVRCGLIHEGRVKGKWKIKAFKGVKGEVMRTKKFIDLKEDEKILYRTVLHYRLKRYLDIYCSELMAKNSGKLRRFFARKLDHLFDLKPDKKNYGWWKDGR